VTAATADTGAIGAASGLGRVGAIRLPEMATVAFRHRWKILAALLLPPLLAATLLIVLPKVYRAQSDILVKTGREYLAQTEGEGAMTAPSSTKQEEINSEITMLTGRAVAEATINAIGLSTLYPEIADDPPSNESPMDAAVERFAKDLSAEPVKMSTVIGVTFDAPSPELAKRVLDQVIALYISKHTEVFSASRAESYQDSIRTALDQIQQLEQRRSSLKLESGIYDIAAQRQAIITQRVDAETRLQDALNRQAKLAARMDYLASARKKLPSTTTSTATEKNDESIHAREAMIDLRQAESAMAARYGDNNPDLRRVRSQIDTLQRTVGSTSASRTNTATSPSVLSQAVDQEMVMGRAELSSMQAEVDRYRKLAGSLTAELERLERADLELRTTVLRIDVLTQNLKSLQERYQQARTQEQTDLARQASVVQIAPAIASEKAVKPKKLIFGGAGIVAGLLLAGSVALAAVVLNKTVVSEEAAERLLGLPVLAVVPVRKAEASSVALDLE